jgi:hypothetical protein
MSARGLRLVAPLLTPPHERTATAARPLTAAIGAAGEPLCAAVGQVAACGAVPTLRAKETLPSAHKRASEKGPHSRPDRTRGSSAQQRLHGLCFSRGAMLKTRPDTQAAAS